MAIKARPQTDDLIESLSQSPYRYGFYQALRLLEAAHPDKPKIGKSRLLKDDPIRIGQSPSLEFASSTLSSCEPAGDSSAALLMQNFFGVFGPNGPLPLHITEHAFQRLHHHHDPTFCRFVDMFHHRLGTLFYRIWADAEPAMDFNHAQEQSFAKYVGSFLGIGTSNMQSRDALPDLAKLHLSGQFSNGPRHAEGLLAILQHLFEIPVKITEFVGEWLPLPDDACCYLGAIDSVGSLGVDLVIGARVFECQNRFSLCFGPIDLIDFEAFLPHSSRIERLLACIRTYVGDQYSWEFRLILKKEEIPPLKLGQYGQLGWTSWLNSKTRDSDSKDFHFDPFSHR